VFLLTIAILTHPLRVNSCAIWKTMTHGLGSDSSENARPGKNEPRLRHPGLYLNFFVSDSNYFTLFLCACKLLSCYHLQSIRVITKAEVNRKNIIYPKSVVSRSVSDLTPKNCAIDN